MITSVYQKMTKPMPKFRVVSEESNKGFVIFSNRNFNCQITNMIRPYVKNFESLNILTQWVINNLGPSFVSIHTNIPNKEPVHARLCMKCNQSPRNTRIKTFQTTRHICSSSSPSYSILEIPRLQRFDHNVPNE